MLKENQGGACGCAKHLCVSKVPIFSSFSREELQQVYELIQHKTMKKGEFLIREGEAVCTLFIINEGKMKLFHGTKEGREQILRILKEGDSIGELQLLKEKVFEGNVKTVTDCNVCMLGKDDFQQLLLKNPMLGLKVLEAVGERLEQMERLAVVLGEKDADTKLAYILLEFAERYGVKQEDKIKITLPISKEEMASYAGLTRETFSRKLSGFADAGIIQMIGHKTIEVLEEDALLDFL